MKYTKYLFFLFICLFLNACSDDKNNDNGGNGGGKEEDERPETLAWIEDTMREHYYWYNEIPAANKLSYNINQNDEEAVTTFFNSLLYKGKDKDGSGDGKTYSSGERYYYSFILNQKTTRTIQESNTYGFDFQLVNGFLDNKYKVLILYVLPESPAEIAGLKRGDWITEIDGKAMSSLADIISLYGSGATTFTIAQWNNTEKDFINPTQVSIGEAHEIELNPILKADVLTSSTGKKVGYLVYNSFRAGIADSDTDKTYDNKLRELSNNTFNDVDEFVLDLRYNGGGLLSSTQVLCAILGSDEVLKTEQFGYLHKNDDIYYYFQAKDKELGTGKNLNLDRLFVLVSATTASASEAVINLLDPFMDVIVIGRTTEGKNMGSESFTSDDKTWEMHPITSKIFNSKKKSEYANGWIPDYEKGDVFDFDSQNRVTLQDKIYGLGDPEERLLKIALNIIDNKTPETRSSSATSGAPKFKADINSLERYATNSVIVDIDLNK